MKLHLLVIALSAIVACNHQKEAVDDPTLLKPQTGVMLEGNIAGPKGSMELTLDKEENLRRIKNLPGYKDLTPEQQKLVREGILSTMPTKGENDKKETQKTSLLTSAPCDTLHATAAGCTPILVFYALSCPGGYAFSKTACNCVYETSAPEGSNKCYTYFQSNGQNLFRGGHWMIESVGEGFPKWCGEVCGD